MIGSPVQTRADSESANSDPMQNDCINNYKTKTNTGSKSKNTIENLKHNKYIFQEWGVTKPPPVIDFALTASTNDCSCDADVENLTSN